MVYLVKGQVAEFEKNRQIHVTDYRRGDHVREDHHGKLSAVHVNFSAQTVHRDGRYETGHQRKRHEQSALVFIAQHVFLYDGK